jgi:methylmalonyl-CoA mutase N-terminal domain/subunit
VKLALDNVRKVASSEQNLMPPLIKAAHAGATLGEIVIEMKKVFGEWNETPAF